MLCAACLCKVGWCWKMREVGAHVGHYTRHLAAFCNERLCEPVVLIWASPLLSDSSSDTWIRSCACFQSLFISVHPPTPFSVSVWRIILELTADWAYFLIQWDPSAKSLLPIGITSFIDFSLLIWIWSIIISFYIPGLLEWLSYLWQLCSVHVQGLGYLYIMQVFSHSGWGKT